MIIFPIFYLQKFCAMLKARCEALIVLINMIVISAYIFLKPPLCSPLSASDRGGDYLAMVTLPAELLTTTEKSAPLSAVVVADVVYDAPVAPETFTPFLRHW